MDKRSWARGAVSLAVLGGLVAALVASPVGAALSKKKVKKISRKQAAAAVNQLTPGIVNSLAPGIASAAVDSYAGAKEGVFASTKEGQTSVPDVMFTIHSLSVPAGSYALFGKVVIIDSTDVTTQCRLEAESDVDQGSVNVTEGFAGADASATIGLQVAHTFAAGGTVELKCTDLLAGDNYDFASIIGIRAPAITG